ncbi:hypothetical protein RIF29_06249 [Crotalaria pallida]|uniref:Uncharacterized protein n=1 Tax=Crotalaria pallida TaxID=3830 RepID=A0AAN9PB59_CROPI
MMVQPYNSTVTCQFKRNGIEICLRKGTRIRSVEASRFLHTRQSKVFTIFKLLDNDKASSTILVFLHKSMDL